jgi:pyruvate/2-oxoglutarate dehydrogenase complex dihydrolipoamide dehydrogenase (E3) component
MMVVFRSGVELMEGRGKLLDPHTVEVDGKKFTVGLVRWMVWPCLPA